MKSVLNIHWKDWRWSWNSNTLATWCEELTHWKRPWCWERLKAGGEGMKEWTADEMVGWDHWLNGHEFWVNLPGDGDGQGGLACCSLWDLKDLDTTESLNCLQYFTNTQILESLRFHASTVYSWLKVPIPLVIAFLEIVLWVQFFWERHNLLKRYRKELKP